MNQLALIKHGFPIAMIVLSLGAGVMYGISQEYAKAVYWCAAAVLTTTTLFM